MKIKALIVACVIGLTGCSYNESEMNDAQAACDSRNGKLSVTTQNNSVILAHCTFGGFKYTYIRNTGAFTNAEIAE